MEQALQELLDKNACEEVLMRYARTLDWLDREGRPVVFGPKLRWITVFILATVLDGWSV